MSSFFSRIGDFVAQLMGGGTLEIILLIVLIVVALILLLVALWLLWKLLALLGKGLLWLFRRGSETYQARSQAQREAALSEPPPVATGWSTGLRIGLRMALMEARRLTGADALRIVVVAGDGFGDLCRSLGLSPPGAGKVGIAAGGDTVLIDAAKANSRTLGRLARALPWRRPVDGLAVLVDANGIPSDGVSRAARFARATGMHVALHLVLASAGKVSAWRVIDATNANGGEICAQLAADTARLWLSGDSREGLNELAAAQARDLPTAVDRVLAVAPSSVVDVASLGFGGGGLRGAVAQTVERTRPTTAPGLLIGAAATALVAGVLLAILATIVVVDRSDRLAQAVKTAAREAAVPWVAEGIDTVPSGARVSRVAGLGTRLAELSDYSLLVPLAPVVPNYSAPADLGRAFLDGYVLRPLATALEWRGAERLAPSDDPGRWIEEARLVGEWFAAWEGLADDPREVDIRALLAAAFGGGKNAWPEGIDDALLATGLEPPLPGDGGLDVSGLTELARGNFILTMQNWATEVYANGPVATAARRASDRSSPWREQHAALVALRTALQDPAQQWITAAEDRPDHVFELRMLGRAVALSLIGQVTALEAKAAISRIRIDAREQAEYFLLPEIGPLMVRSGTGSGPSLSLTPGATAWLGFLDKIANAGFADLPRTAPPPLVGLATIDPVAVAEARRRLRVFDQFAGDLPAGLPPAVAQKLVRDLASELVIGVTTDVENALRPASDLGIALERAERRGKAAPALDDLTEVEEWLRQRQGQREADRVHFVRSRVAEGVLAAAGGVLREEDPLGIHLDPTADGNALVRRFDRGVARLMRIHEQLAAPFIEAAGQGRGWSALEWRDMAADIDGYGRGDVDSTLTALEGAVRAFADDPVAACDAPRIPSGRGDYLARTAVRFNATIDQECKRRTLAEARRAFERVREYFDRNVAWLWPYAADVNAPEIVPTTLTDFLRQLDDTVDAFAEAPLDEPLTATFTETNAFWERDSSGAAAVRFRVAWRSQPSEENLAEHVAEVRINGAEADEDGVYTWRYGAPFSVSVRLAKNSAYRFAKPDGVESDERQFDGNGNGSLLRVLAGMARGALTLEADVVGDTGARDTLRLSGRVVHADGRPLEVPNFAEAGTLAMQTNGPRNQATDAKPRI